jgi:hypothetical protein
VAGVARLLCTERGELDRHTRTPSPLNSKGFSRHTA